MMNINTLKEISRLKSNNLNAIHNERIRNFDRSDLRNTRNAFIQMIDHQPNKYSLTISYPSGTSDLNTNRSLTLFMHFLNQRVLTHSYKKRDVFVDGFVARERTKNGTLHYHIILNENKAQLPDYNEFNLMVKKCINKVKTNHESKKTITGNKGWNLQAYFHNGKGGFEGYITKNFECSKSDADEAFNSIGIMNYDKVEFGGAPRK
jgi:hypothetical protein